LTVLISVKRTRSKGLSYVEYGRSESVI
jgi:hypothetical protein